PSRNAQRRRTVADSSNQRWGHPPAQAQKIRCVATETRRHGDGERGKERPQRKSYAAVPVVPLSPYLCGSVSPWLRLLALNRHVIGRHAVDADDNFHAALSSSSQTRRHFNVQLVKRS